MSGKADQSRFAKPSVAGEAVRRGADLLLAAAGLIAFSPLMLGCVVWIRRIDGGGAFYRQYRVGRDGRLFRIYKLRTMRFDAERGEGARFASEADSRILPGCGWMRRSHVDELPQLLNILRGQMSLVGPRPERPEMFHRMDDSLPGFERRLAVSPGLTGLAQLRCGYAHDEAGLRRKLAWDLRYLRRRTLGGDLVLILRTFPLFWDRAAF
jgi:lipopolysaccharide/colanic/teichoic acid biosynthesis glycosyltransferase